MSCSLQAAWSQELRDRSLLKRSEPRLSVGRGPLMKTVLPHVFKNSNRLLNLALSTSDCRWAVSFVPTWTMMRLTEGGVDWSRSGSFSNSELTVAPGRQCVVELCRRMFLVMESPTTILVGGEGRGRVERGARRQKEGRKEREEWK